MDWRVRHMARSPNASAATRWRRCCRCSRHWRPARTCCPCTPDPTAGCGWRSRMSAEPLHPGVRAAGPVRLDRSNVVTVIPALNEALRIRGVVEGALQHCDRIIVVDDGSDDATLARIADLPVTVLRHAQRCGKGASLRDGFQAALQLGGRAVLTMDGDGQHAPEDMPRLIEAANAYPEHVVIGARLRKRSQQPLYRR